MKKLDSIVIERAEGPSVLCGIKIAYSFEEADQILAENAETAPKGAYDKHYVSVVFADDMEFKTRIDVTNSPKKPPPPLLETVLYHIKFEAGRLSPAEIPKTLDHNTYLSMVKHNGKNYEEANRLLNEYSFE